MQEEVGPWGPRVGPDPEAAQGEKKRELWGRISLYR